MNPSSINKPGFMSINSDSKGAKPAAFVGVDTAEAAMAAKRITEAGSNEVKRQGEPYASAVVTKSREVAGSQPLVQPVEIHSPENPDVSQIHAIAGKPEGLVQVQEPSNT